MCLVYKIVIFKTMLQYSLRLNLYAKIPRLNEPRGILQVVSDYALIWSGQLLS